jgi:RNA polymerase sigma-70 factor (ECF subfamily)
MGEDDDDHADEEKRLLECRTAVERRDFLARHFTKDRARLRQMVALRLDPRLQGRLDPSDVLQEAFIEAARRLDEYIQARPMPIFLWVRRITVQKLADLHRQHLGAKARDARREASIHQGPHASSATLAAQIVDQSLAPSQRAARDPP